jgi:hypothetical protein
VISKEVESIKKKQDEMGEIVAQRQMNMTGLYDTIVTPIKPAMARSRRPQQFSE